MATPPSAIVDQQRRPTFYSLVASTNVNVEAIQKQNYIQPGVG
jgi:hypothetical protein